MTGLPGKVPWQARAYDASRRLYDASRRLTALFGEGTRALFVGTWLGLLDRHALHAADELYYRRARMYRTDSYNLSGLSPWEAEALERHFQGCRSVIITAAGGGREAVALERRGLDVSAFECHPELVEVGNELLARQGLRSRIALAPRDECPTCLSMCDGAIVGWGSYMLTQERARRIRFLQQLRTHLPIGGPVLLSFFARKQHNRYLRLAAAIANGLRHVRGKSKVEVGDDLIPNFVHHFTETEIAAELEAGGFRLVEFSWDGYPHAIAQAAGSAEAPSVVENTDGR